VSIPLLDILNLPESARSPGDVAEVATARANRSAELLITIVLGPAANKFVLRVLPTF
jgi:hypothetical protein